MNTTTRGNESAGNGRRTVPVPVAQRIAFAVLLCFAGLAVHQAQAAIPAGERQALVELYNATGGAGWTNNTGWLGGAGTECQWHGVVCNGAEDHVVTLYLYGNNLANFLPDLSALQMLVWMDLNGNQLIGSLPPAQSLPQSLQVLWLSDNEFDGSIPDYSNLPSLQELYIGGNRLSGPLPSAKNIRGLKVFEAGSNVPDRNRFDSPIPQPFAGTNIESYNVSNSGLTGALPELNGSDYPNLAYFYAALNNLEGPIPSLSAIPTLNEFNVGFNHLSGEIPDISSNPELTRFWVENNELTGNVPDISSNTRLKSLNLENNQLSGEFPSCPQETILRQLKVGNNKFHSMTAISTCMGLDSIEMSSAFDAGGDMPDISRMLQLRTFIGNNNGFTGSFPSLPPGISVLDISHNNFSGRVPALPEYLLYTTISRIDIGFNSFVGNLPQLDDGEGGVSVYNPRISRVCPNQLDLTSNAEWDVITNTSPWFLDCTSDSIFRNGFE